MGPTARCGCGEKPHRGLWDQVGSYGHVSRAFMGALSGRHKKPVLGYAARKNEVRKGTWLSL